MSVPARDSAHCLLHVRPEPLRGGQSVSAIDELVRRAGGLPEVVGDVYRALALLCREGTDYAGAVVCVDDLGPPEMEFFKLAGRVRPQTRVLVYGKTRAESRIRTAIALGAAGVADEESVSLLLGDDAPAPERLVGARLMAPLTETPDHPIADAGKKNDGAVDEETESARVPWLRYEDRPSRGAPGREPRGPVAEPAFVPDPVTPVAPEPPAPAQKKDHAQPPDAVPMAPIRKDPPEITRIPAAENYEPLLTDEELRALLGDDEPGHEKEPTKKPGPGTGGSTKP